MSRVDLEVFRAPRSVTVVGASADPTKWGWWLARGALLGAGRREVHLVNRRGIEVAGSRTVPTLADVPGSLDLVVLSVPPDGVPALVDEALDQGARGLVGITAGLDRVVEKRLAGVIRSRGARLIGPNCLGLYDAEAELQLAWGHFRPGRLAIVSQSGQVGSELAGLAAERGLGVSRFVSLGNQADVRAAEVVADLADHEPTAVVALYLESFGNGAALVEAIRSLAEAGTPTVLLAVGGSDASRAAALSHTGALTSDLDVVDAACRSAGAVRVDTPQQLIDTAHLLAHARRSRGHRVAVVGDSGGQGAVATDVLVRAGLSAATFPEPVRADLAALLPPGAGVANPVDLAGAGEADLGRYADVVDRLVACEEVDSVVLTGYFGSYAAHTPGLAEREQSVAERIADAAVSTPVVVHSMATDNDVLALLEERGVPSWHTIDGVATALGAEARLAAPRRVTPYDAGGETPGPGYLAARTWLSSAGVAFPAACGVRSPHELAEAAEALRPPLVLKADWIVHKTEHDAVRVGIPDRTALLEAYDEMADRLGHGCFVVEEQDTRADVVELIVGARRDPAFGPIVLVGAGGILTELVRDTAVELAPVDPGEAEAMLRRLQVWPAMTGFRGRAPLAVAAVAELVATVSRALAAAPPSVAAVELNPVRVGPDGALAVDALVVGTPDTGGIA